MSLGEQDVPCRDTVESVADPEVKAQGALHVGRLQAGDGQAKGGGYGVDDILEGMEIADGCKQLGTSEKPGLRLTIGNVDVVNVVLPKELEHVLGGFECDVATKSVGLDSSPECDASGNRLAAAILELLLPAKAGEVDRGKPDLSLV